MGVLAAPTTTTSLPERQEEEVERPRANTRENITKG